MRPMQSRRSRASPPGLAAERPQSAQPLLQRLARDARLWLTVLAVAVGVGALAAAMVRQGEHALAEQRAATLRYVHTQDVLVAVGAFTTALSETQRGAGGYLLSGDPAFAARHATGARATLDHLQRVQALTADNPDQQRRVSALAAETKIVLGVTEREVELEASGQHAAALALVHSKAAHVAIQRAQTISAAFIAEEQRLLAARRAAAEEAASNTARVTTVLALLGAGFLAAAAGLGSIALAAASRARLANVRAEAHERQASSAAPLALFIAKAPAAIAMFDRQMRYLAASRRYVTDYGLPAGTVLEGRSHYEVFPEVPDRWRDIHARVLAGATESHEQDPFPRADGRVDWVRWRMEPWRDAQGEIGGALLFSEVITSQIEARQAQVAAEARLRAIVETAVDAILVIDEGGVIQSANPATEALFGYDAESLVGRNVSILMPEPNRSAHDGYLSAYLRTGKRKIIGVGREVDGLRKDGSRVPIDLSVAEWRVEGRRFFTGLMRDITARRFAEAERLRAERRELVVGELRHRISNMFAVISSLITTTARSHQDVGAYRDAVLGRIHAFAATQMELARKEWSSLGLRDLLEFELRPYTEGRNVALEGQDLSLQPTAAESLAMVVHELATNAAKYGALSQPDARLDIRWRLSVDAAGEARLVLDWIERGGPPVTPPKRRGFGSTVIESCARTLGGTARFDYLPEGVRCTLDMLASRALL